VKFVEEVVHKLRYNIRYAKCLTWVQTSKQASSFFNKNLTNADNDNSMNISTKMEMSLVNKPANNV